MEPPERLQWRVLTGVNSSLFITAIIACVALVLGIAALFITPTAEVVPVVDCHDRYPRVDLEDGNWLGLGRGIDGRRRVADGHITNATVGSLAEAWTYETAGEVMVQPVTHAGILYFCDTVGYLYALRSATGHGKMRVYRTDGVVLDCEYDNNQQHGETLRTLPHGHVRREIWERDKFVRLCNTVQSLLVLCVERIATHPELVELSVAHLPDELADLIHNCDTSRSFDVIDKPYFVPVRPQIKHDSKYCKFPPSVFFRCCCVMCV